MPQSARPDLFFQLNSQFLAISIIALATYSFILNMTTRYNRNLLLRDGWIFCCAVYNLLGFYIVQARPAMDPASFIWFNKALLTIIPCIIVLVYYDMSSTTGVHPRFLNRWFVLLCAIPQVFIFLPDSMTFIAGTYTVHFGYCAYVATCFTLALVPVLLFVFWMFRRDRTASLGTQLWFFVLCYLVLLITMSLDGTDFPLLNGKSPRSVFAIFVLALFGVISNSIRYKKITDNMHYFAVYDELTDTLKRKSGIDLIEKRISANKVSGAPFSIILFDINNFKRINDYYGYYAGNVCLSHVAQQIKAQLRPGDHICRSEGDEFLIVTEGELTLDSPLIHHLLERVDNVWKYENHMLVLKYRIGISVFPKHGTSVSELMKNADESLIEAKKINAPQVIVYNESLAEKRREIDRITEQLKETLSSSSDSRQFVLYYQPKVDRFGKVLSAECLLRWIYDDKLYMPGSFIEIAEKTGLIHEIGDIVLDSGCRELSLLSGTYPNVSLALNLSPQQLNNTKILEQIKEKVTIHNVNTQQLELELTESTIMDCWNHLDIEQFIQNIRACGIKISIDDFGTGLSSFGRLLELPADILKIDRSFIIHLPENKKSQLMCASITGLAHELGMSVVAEGVELAGQADFLFSIGCDLIQGYYYYKPMPRADFIDLLQKH